MEDIRTRVMRDTVVDLGFRVRVFDDVRVVVVDVDEWDDVIIAATAVEQSLDVRFFGTSWRLVELRDGLLSLLVFGGYDSDGRLVKPELLDLPMAMDWIGPALGS